MGFYVKFHPNWQLNEKAKTKNNGAETYRIFAFVLQLFFDTRKRTFITAIRTARFN